MKRVLFLRILALGAGFLLPAAGGAGDLPTGWSTNVFIPAAPGQLENRYALFLPAQYYATAKLWPLILFLHGSSDCGASPTLLYQRGPVDGTRNQGDFPCLVVSPICPRGAVWWDEQERPTLMALLDHIAAICRVDTNRIYLTGLSLGSLGAWDLCATYPERFAAVVPIAAAGNTARLDRIKDLPLWYFTGAKDSIGGAIYSEQMFKSLRALGSNARLTVYPDCDHDAWTATYRRVDLYDWLFRQRRQAAPAPLEADAESAAYIRAWQ
jgi:predicted peptidase